MTANHAGDLSLDAIMREVREELERRPMAAAANSGAAATEKSNANFLRRALSRAERLIARRARRASCL